MTYPPTSGDRLSVIASRAAARCPDDGRSPIADSHHRSDDDFELDIADLDDVIHLERLLLPRIDTVAVEVGAVGTVEVFEEEAVFLETDQGVLPRAPDTLGRFLILQVDVDRLLVGPADEVEPLVDRVLDIAALPTQHQQPRRRAFMQGARFDRRRGGCRGGRGRLNLRRRGGLDLWRRGGRRGGGPAPWGGRGGGAAPGGGGGGARGGDGGGRGGFRPGAGRAPPAGRGRPGGARPAPPRPGRPRGARPAPPRPAWPPSAASPRPAPPPADRAPPGPAPAR